MVIVWLPTVTVVAGLELNRPWVSKRKTPLGLAVVFAGAVF
jgi:hypothetical protein